MPTTGKPYWKLLKWIVVTGVLGGILFALPDPAWLQYLFFSGSMLVSYKLGVRDADK